MRRHLLRTKVSRPIVLRLGCAICATTIMTATLGCSTSDDGEEVSVLDNSVQASESDDKAPAETPNDPSLSFETEWGTQNHSTDRYRFDVAAYVDDAERQKAEKLYPSHAAFLTQIQQQTAPSVQTLGTYVKQIDDTIYAGVERAVQDGLAPTLEPKVTLLTGALSYLTAHRSADADVALVHVATALKLGGQTPDIPSDLSAQVDALSTEYLAAKEESKPFGFYTWSVDLQKIWQQDRLLQRPLPAASACSLAEAIASDAPRKQQYLNLTSLYSRLTNPLVSSLDDILDTASEATCASGDDRAFLSRSATPEVALFNQLYPNGVPDNADLMGDLVKAIRAGTIDLKPASGDGWYQHQLFALETLLVTDRSEERNKVAFMARYKERLREAFSTMLTQHRETHAKQADEAMGVSAPAPTTPQFRLEPMATVYVRHARSYVFLEQAMAPILGESVLDGANTVDAQGETGTTLRTRIHDARDLLFGLYILSCQDIGLSISLNEPGDPAPSQWTSLAAAASTWLANLSNDPIAKSDVRVIVPIAEVDQGRKKYWAVVGVRGTLGGYSYIKGTDVSPPKPEDQTRLWLPTEQFLEVTSSATPMTREEFRSLCDSNKTVEAIKSALEAR